MNKNEIIEKLNKNKLKNISTIGVIENYGIKSSLKDKDSFLITVKTDHLWCYPAAENEKELKNLLNKFRFKTLYFASLEKWMLPVLSENREIDWQLKTERLILPEKDEMNLLLQNNVNKNRKILETETEVEIRAIQNKDVNFIFAHSHYQEFTSKEYIRERIEADCSAGIIIKGELAAWGLTHDDGAVGFIHVRKKFKRRGFAQLITENLIRDKRKNNRDVFLNVELDNSKAKKLFYSLGFKFDREISWIKLSEE